MLGERQGPFLRARPSRHSGAPQMSLTSSGSSPKQTRQNSLPSGSFMTWNRSPAPRRWRPAVGPSSSATSVHASRSGTSRSRWRRFFTTLPSARVGSPASCRHHRSPWCRPSRRRSAQWHVEQHAPERRQQQRVAAIEYHSPELRLAHITRGYCEALRPAWPRVCGAWLRPPRLPQPRPPAPAGRPRGQADVAASSQSTWSASLPTSSALYQVRSSVSFKWFWTSVSASGAFTHRRRRRTGESASPRRHHRRAAGL